MLLFQQHELAQHGRLQLHVLARGGAPPQLQRVEEPLDLPWVAARAAGQDRGDGRRPGQVRGKPGRDRDAQVSHGTEVEGHAQ